MNNLLKIMCVGVMLSGTTYGVNKLAIENKIYDRAQDLKYSANARAQGVKDGVKDSAKDDIQKRYDDNLPAQYNIAVDEEYEYIAEED